MTHPHSSAASHGRRRDRSASFGRERGAAWIVVAVAVLLAGAAATAPSRTSGGPSTVAPPAGESEYPVKAAFVNHFIGYTTWPKRSFEDRTSPIVVLVVGKNPFGKFLEIALRDKVVGGRKIVLRHSRTVPDEIDAHVAFEGDLSNKERKKLLHLCKGRPTLLIGERSGYAALGAQFNFYLEKDNVRFEVNIDAVEESGLEVSSQLLKLARIVRRRER